MGGERVRNGTLSPDFKECTTLFTSSFQLPTFKVIDRPLIVGALIFGLAWGLSSFCPGPGLTSIFSGNINPIFLVIGMSAGMPSAPKVEDLLIPRQVEPQG